MDPIVLHNCDYGVLATKIMPLQYSEDYDYAIYQGALATVRRIGGKYRLQPWSTKKWMTVPSFERLRIEHSHLLPVPSRMPEWHGDYCDALVILAYKQVAVADAPAFIASTTPTAVYKFGPDIFICHDSFVRDFPFRNDNDKDCTNVYFCLGKMLHIPKHTPIHPAVMAVWINAFLDDVDWWITSKVTYTSWQSRGEDHFLFVFLPVEHLSDPRQPAEELFGDQPTSKRKTKKKRRANREGSIPEGVDVPAPATEGEPDEVPAPEPSKSGSEDTASESDHVLAASESDHETNPAADSTLTLKSTVSEHDTKPKGDQQRIEYLELQLILMKADAVVDVHLLRILSIQVCGEL
eukprot:TRINITY_DN9106_c0_g1_i2.p1 TRINITY_DN9106_c0_g1~~TRINITY_DN9106_c0_g1_i2.p1  ORF type:complete len:358 (-),score=49.27 TRINITY_DN9106_c0_g1_i2:125-1177(-)